MDVTSSNFDEALSKLEELLKDCAFVAIDEEMTGIKLDSTTEPAGNDTPETRYAKMRRVAATYNIIQFGVCVFTREEEGDGYVAHPFNFFVFPDKNARDHTSTITMSSDTADFLRGVKMNFNTWIYDGIKFSNQEAYDRQVQEVTVVREAKISDGRKLSLDRESDVAFLRGTMDGVKAWLDAGGEGEYVSEPLNSYMRRAVYQEAAAEVPDLNVTSRKVDDRRSTMVFAVMTEEEKAQAKQAEVQAKLDDIDARSGALRMFRALASSGKPIVGHNCMYDLMFMFSHFCGALPATLAEFKKRLSALMPLIYDTKYISSMSTEWKDTVLKGLYHDVMANKPGSTFTLAPGFDRYSTNEGYHEAAYDAWVTGCVFARIGGHMLDEEEPEMLNRLYMMKSLFAVNLAGRDGIAMNGGCAHISFADKGIVTTDIKAAFDGTRHFIKWIDDYSAFVICQDLSTNAEVVAYAVEKGVAADKGLKVVPFEEWDEISPPRVPVPESGAKRKRSDEKEGAVETVGASAMETEDASWGGLLSLFSGSKRRAMDDGDVPFWRRMMRPFLN